MNDLIAWLTTQLDEVERVAREASGDAWITGAAAGYRYAHPGDVYAIAQNGTAALIAQGKRCGPDISAEQSSAHIACHNPAYVLAEVEAKRRILGLHVKGGEQSGFAYCATCGSAEPCEYPRAWPCDTVLLLALPFADRPGYLESWRPSDGDD